MTVKSDIAVVFDRTSGAVQLGWGASVAVVTPDQQWDVTPDENSGCAFTDETGFAGLDIKAEIAAPSGATSRVLLFSRNGSAIRVECIDPATGALANAGAPVRLFVDRMGPGPSD